VPAPPPPNEKRRAEVNAGRIAGVFGLHGELKFDASRAGDDALRPGLAAVLTLADGTARPVTIAAVRRHKGRPLVRIAGIDDATAAQALTGARVAIARNDAPLGPGEYFDDDLIGCRILDAAGADCGAVVDVVHYPNGDMLAVGPARTLVPMVRAFIAGIDIEGRVIRIDAPPGLLDPAAAEPG
jgi:16S rRNA processing protein RimM